MALPLTVPPSLKHQSLLWSPICTDLDALDAHVAILGIPFGSAYHAAAITNDQTKAPDAVPPSRIGSAAAWSAMTSTSVAQSMAGVP